jgi:hypothetical protein
MAQQTAITLTDATPTTPVNRVFNPAKKDGDVYRYDYRGTGIVVGYDNLTVNTKLPSKTSKATKVQFRLTCPILEQTSPSTASGIQPAPSVAYSNIFDMTFVLAERSVLQDRKNLLSMARDLIDEALTTAAVENYDAPYF